MEFKKLILCHLIMKFLEILISLLCPFYLFLMIWGNCNIGHQSFSPCMVEASSKFFEVRGGKLLELTFLAQNIYDHIGLSWMILNRALILFQRKIHPLPLSDVKILLPKGIFQSFYDEWISRIHFPTNSASISLMQNYGANSKSLCGNFFHAPSVFGKFKQPYFLLE